MVRSCDEKRRLKLHEKNYVNGRRSRGRQKKQWGDTTRHEMSPIEARIRIQPEQHTILKIQNLHEKWVKFEKNAKRWTETQKEKGFVEDLDNLFDMVQECFQPD